jgi:hypothetical protein
MKTARDARIARENSTMKKRKSVVSLLLFSPGACGDAASP